MARSIRFIPLTGLLAVVFTCFVGCPDCPGKTQPTPSSQSTTNTQTTQTATAKSNQGFRFVPTEFAVWAQNCPLRDNGDYSMYSDQTPDSRYIDNRNGTITDTCTKLIWEKNESGSRGSWSKAQKHCESLRTANLSDWRLPTNMELQSLIDYSGVADYSSKKVIAINSVFGSKSEEAWAATRSAERADQAWSVDFVSRSIGDYDESESFGVRCVSGRTSLPIAEHYAIAEKTVTDNFTGLQWQRKLSDNEKGSSMINAVSFCRNLKLDGSGWRLPTAKELATLVDIDRRAGPKIDAKAFPDTPSERFWTSTRQTSDSGIVVLFTLERGNVGPTHVDIEDRVRCVR